MRTLNTGSELISSWSKIDAQYLDNDGVVTSEGLHPTVVTILTNGKLVPNLVTKLKPTTHKSV